MGLTGIRAVLKFYILEQPFFGYLSYTHIKCCNKKHSFCEKILLFIEAPFRTIPYIKYHRQFTQDRFVEPVR
jgi:hypothetical protein